MQPMYLTATTASSVGATLPSAWWLTNWNGLAPFNIGLSVDVSTTFSGGGSTGWRIDVTVDDPTGAYPPPTGSSNPIIFQSSQVAGSGSSVVGVALGTQASTSNFIGSITQPIAALRITNLSTTGNVVLTVLQSGIG